MNKNTKYQTNSISWGISTPCISNSSISSLSRDKNRWFLAVCEIHTFRQPFYYFIIKIILNDIIIYDKDKIAELLLDKKNIKAINKLITLLVSKTEP